MAAIPRLIAWVWMLLSVVAVLAHAAAIDVNVSTPAIRSVKASMAARLQQLQPFYAKGAVGETNDGLLAVRDTGALSLQEKATVTRLVEQENRDRQALYGEVIRANTVDAGATAEVRRLFAQTWRNQSAPGWWIQQDSGAWTRK